MPRVVPSDVVKAIDRMFPQMVETPDKFPNVTFESIPSLNAIA
jgi:hypothetical protein